MDPIFHHFGSKWPIRTPFFRISNSRRERLSCCSCETGCNVTLGETAPCQCTSFQSACFGHLQAQVLLMSKNPFRGFWLFSFFLVNVSAHVSVKEKSLSEISLLSCWRKSPYCYLNLNSLSFTQIFWITLDRSLFYITTHSCRHSSLPRFHFSHPFKSKLSQDFKASLPFERNMVKQKGFFLGRVLSIMFSYTYNNNSKHSEMM